MAKRRNNPTTKSRPSVADRLEMVKQFRGSGLTRRAFCEKAGVAKSTLDWWLRKSRRSGNSKGPRGSRKKRVAFQEMALVARGVEFPGNWLIEIVSPEGWTIRSRQMLGVDDVARLLREGRC